MTPEQRAEAVKAVRQYRAAAARMRRNSMRPVQPREGTHARNEQLRIEALKTLCRLGLADVADALDASDQQCQQIAAARRDGRDATAQRAQLLAIERMIREALSAVTA